LKKIKTGRDGRWYVDRKPLRGCCSCSNSRYCRRRGSKLWSDCVAVN